MSIRLPLILLAMSLAACGAGQRDVRDQALSDFNLADGAVASRLISRLPDEERGVFRTFLLHHYVLSKGFCGDTLVNAEGREAETVGEAIKLTRQRELRLAAIGKENDLSAVPPRGLVQIKINRLIDQREELGDRVADAEMLGQAIDLPEIERKMADIDREVAALRIELQKLTPA